MVRRIVAVVALAGLAVVPMSAQCYHWLFGGKVVYADGHEQVFNGLRCFQSGRLYWNRNIEALKQDYARSTSVDLEQVTQIDFEGPATDLGFRRGIRKGTVTLSGPDQLKPDQLKSVYLFAGECEWAKYQSDKFTCNDKATLEGPLTEEGLQKVLISRSPKSASK